MSVEKSVCPLQWDYMCARINSKQHTMCCHAPWHDITQTQLDSQDYNNVVNSVPLRNIRLNMLRGIRPQECSICWNHEDNGVESFRQRMNRDNPERMQYLIDHAHEATDIDSPILYSDSPRFLEIHLGNTCDMKCIYCSPEWSSQWALEKLQKKQITEERYKKISINPSSEYTNMLWKYIDSVGKSSIKRIGFIGGEPLTNPYFQDILSKLFELFKDGHEHDVQLWIVTNLNTPEKYFDQFVDMLPKLTERFKVEISISMESTGAQAEYIRQGLDWQRFNNNVHKIYEKTKDIEYVRLAFKSTISAPSVPYTQNFIKWIRQLEELYGPITLGFTTITYPESQNPFILPKEFSGYIDNAIGELDTNHPNYQSYSTILAKIRDGIANGESKVELRRAFYNWFTENDSTRNVNFAETFPELKDFFNECGKL